MTSLIEANQGAILEREAIEKGVRQIVAPPCLVDYFHRGYVADAANGARIDAAGLDRALAVQLH